MPDDTKVGSNEAATLGGELEATLGLTETTAVGDKLDFTLGALLAAEDGTLD